jgi:nuclear GTP-binding protein
LKGGVPDKVAAARSVLRDWNTGKIPYYTAPPVQEATKSASHNNAVIVAEFGDALDLSKVDEVVLQSLEKRRRDEVDFVPLRHDEGADMEMEGEDDAAANATTFLTGGGSDDDSMDVNSSDDDDDDEAEDAQQRIADADDYDFDGM